MSAPVGDGDLAQAAAAETPPGVEVGDRPPMASDAFMQLMDVLVPDGTDTEPAGTPEAGVGGAAADAAAPAGGSTDQNAGAAAATPADGGAAGTPAAGDPAAAAGNPPADAAGSGGADHASGGTLEPAELTTHLGDISTKFEERTTAAYQQAALAEVRTEHEQYFKALEQHPRLLVGTQVPAIGKDGTETLSSTEDAKDWQEAVRSILVEEIKERATKSMDDNQQFLDTVHASIKLFQDNLDLIPTSKSFDKDLAERFVKLAEPYELRVEGKLQGYAIPVQPLVDQLRTQLAAERAAAAPPAAAAAPAAGAPAATPTDPPQAGIPSKAGSSAEVEEYSTLFGTIGLPNLRI